MPPKGYESVSLKIEYIEKAGKLSEHLGHSSVPDLIMRLIDDKEKEVDSHGN